MQTRTQILYRHLLRQLAEWEASDSPRSARSINSWWTKPTIRSLMLTVACLRQLEFSLRRATNYCWVLQQRRSVLMERLYRRFTNEFPTCIKCGKPSKMDGSCPCGVIGFRPTLPSAKLESRMAILSRANSPRVLTLRVATDR